MHAIRFSIISRFDRTFRRVAAGAAIGMFATVTLAACVDPSGSGTAGTGGGGIGTGGGGAGGSGGGQAAGPAGVTGSAVLAGHVAIPDLTFQLRDPVTHQPLLPEVKSNLVGQFAIPKQPAGTYELCWSGGGFDSACAPDPVVLAGDHVTHPPVDVTASSGAVRGRVLLADGKTPCRFFDIFFGIDVWTDVSVVDTSNGQVLASARANSFGEFAIPGAFSKKKSLVVRAKCEASTIEAPIDGGLENVGDLLLPNHRPTISGTFAYQGGKGLRKISPGSTVDASVKAKDDDGDILHYQWKTIDGSGTVVGGDSQDVKWNLPTLAARHTLYVVAHDEMGGYASGRVSLGVGDDQRFFAGRVIGWEGEPLDGAIVRVNGTTTKTDASGGFSFFVPPDKGDRYVLNARKEGYAPVSQIYDREVSGGQFRLLKAQTVKVKTDGDIVVTDKDSSLVAKAKAAPITLKIPPKSLVDEAGQPPPGGVLTLEMATLDPALAPIPGDYSGIDQKGQRVDLTSYGTLHVELRDATGKRYNLAKGATATLEFPGGPANGPPQIPVWYYDDVAGTWMEYATAVPSAAGKGYTATVSHFSEINLDLPGSNGPNGTCVRVRPDSTIPVGSTLRVLVNGSQVTDLVLDSQDVHGIFRLLLGSTLTLQVLDSQGNAIPAASKIVALDPSFGNHPGNPQTGAYPYPYDDCREIPIGIEVPQYGLNNQNNPLFLTKEGPFNIPVGHTGAELGNGYYEAVDPSTGSPTARATLGGWWSENGFDSAGDASDQVRASYFNHNDLGFGRDMHCRKVGSGPGGLACYVTNYANADQAAAHTVSTAAATVTMEHSVIPGTGPGTGVPVVKFFIYNGGVAAAQRIPEVDLDTHGPKPAPYLCAVCHGQSYTPTDSLHPTALDADMTSSFREFDLPSFTYTGGRTYADLLADRNGTSPPAVAAANTLLDALKSLNQKVKNDAGLPASSAIPELVDGWYSGGGNVPSTAFVPPSWAGASASLYTDVFSTTCRTCHIAQDPSINFNSYSPTNVNGNYNPQFQGRRGSIQYDVCAGSRIMPNAERTYVNFWTSTTPHRPLVLASFSDTVWTSFVSCP